MIYADKITKENIIEVFKKIIPHNDITLFIAGNCTKGQANDIQKILTHLPQKTIPEQLQTTQFKENPLHLSQNLG